MAATIKLGNKDWAARKDFLLAYNDENNNFKPLPFDFTRASSATYIGSDGFIKTSTTAQPRIDFKDNTDGHLLLEPARTNTAINSENSSLYTYRDSVNLSDVAMVTPYGYTSNAVKIEAVAGDNSPIRAASFSLGTYSQNNVITVSAYVKYNGYRYVQFGGYFGNEGARFDLIDGVVTQNLSNVISSSIKKVENDWYKLTTTYTFQNTIGNGNLYAGFVLSTQTNFSHTNSPAGGLYAWGFQAELGSYATSYIPTSGSAVTRAAETCLGSGNDQVINSTEGVLFVEMAALADGVEGGRISVSNGNTSANQYFSLDYRSASNTVRVVFNVGGTNHIVTSIDTGFSNSELNKIAYRYKSGQHALYVNGISKLTSTITNTHSPNTLNEIELQVPNNSSNFYGKIKQLEVYNKALTDSELKTLTT